MRSRRFVAMACVLAAASLHAAPAGKLSTRQLFEAMRDPNELGRYCYLLQTLPRLAPADAMVARQYLAFSESELGLYGEAVRDFPLKSRLPDDIAAPAPPTWEAADAVEAIAGLAAPHRVVMVNEAHHDAHTRLLTLELLPRLRALGFTHLAIEALIEDGDSLRKRGYPVAASGTEYLREPVYGQIVREALRLGYVLVPYDPAQSSPQQREQSQARTLYEKVLSGDPQAKLLVHAGYAHIDKAPGRLGSVQPMAEHLHRLSGLDILSVDMTDVHEDEPYNELQASRAVVSAVRNDEALRGKPETLLTPTRDSRRPLRDAYSQIVAQFHPRGPIVLRNAKDGGLWSARPRLYDVNVILPPASDRISSYARDRVVSVNVGGQSFVALPPAADGHRPGWLALDGRRVPVAIGPEICDQRFPCLVEARLAAESDDAVAADRYVFLEHGPANVLWLQPGAYRVRGVGPEGKVLSERALQVASAN
ncbi:MAG TPA: hypothetical protein VGU03_08350 [Frateuria sp.]|uniref:hypothetical protein n=1 Tax=Frateuria sp. TaxID=2211372 RepID=UPI002DED5184|nr:hypothetical protein [Frateuria sp.]